MSLSTSAVLIVFKAYLMSLGRNSDSRSPWGAAGGTQQKGTRKESACGWTTGRCVWISQHPYWNDKPKWDLQGLRDLLGPAAWWHPIASGAASRWCPLSLVGGWGARCQPGRWSSPAVPVPEGLPQMFPLRAFSGRFYSIFLNSSQRGVIGVGAGIWEVLVPGPWRKGHTFPLGYEDSRGCPWLQCGSLSCSTSRAEMGSTDAPCSACILRWQAWFICLFLYFLARILVLAKRRKKKKKSSIFFPDFLLDPNKKEKKED